MRSPEIFFPRTATALLLLASAVLATLPLITVLPWAIIAALALLFGWRAWLTARVSVAPRLAMWLLAGFTLAIVWWHYRGYLGRDAGGALLALLAAGKLLELRTRRDYHIAVFLVYLLVLINFLHDQSPWRVIYLLAIVALASGVLVRLAVPALDARATRQLVTQLLLMAAPVALLLFFLFPRIQGALWTMPDDRLARTGMSGEMSPGTINSLSQSDEIAFRVQFDGPPPSAAERYFRTLVFWQTDGRHWRRNEALPPSPRWQGGTPVSYEIILEPSGQPWLPALDWPAQPGPDMLRRAGQTLEAPRPVNERRHYRLTSFLQKRDVTLTHAERVRALALPPLPARTQALADGWRATSASEADVVRLALTHFREQGFSYTLTPPLLNSDSPIDEFLFDVKRGFCEHYAAAFVVLMRAAGLPARVVAGYQGGEYNPSGNYLIVRQLDAHAWAEVWLADRGWTRIDPTAMVAQERLDFGAQALRALFAQGAALGRLSASDIQQALAPGRLGDWARRARLALDSAHTQWLRWVQDYNVTRQRELLAALGFENVTPTRLVLALVALIGLVFAVYALIGWLRRPRRDPLARLYDDYCRKLARVGLARAPNEGPVDYAARCARQRPDLAASVRALSDAYVALRYRESGETRAFAQAVAAFRPMRARR